MNQDAPEKHGSARRIGTAVLGLGGFALLAALAVSLTEQATRDRIDANRLAHAMRTVTEVLTDVGYNNEPSTDIVRLQSPEWLGTGEALPAYRARMDSSPAAIAYTVVAPDGYVGNIRLLVGIDTEGRITAARVLENRETPGLGDKIEVGKSNWIRAFSGRKTDFTGLRLRRDGGDIDHISGATITSRAVVNAIGRTVELDAQSAETIETAPADSQLRLQPR